MNTDYAKIGKLIKRRREKLDLTQAVLAERCEITEQYVSNIERAVSIPSTEVIMKLAAALDTTPDAFLVGSSKSPGEEWKAVADKLRPLDGRKLDLVSSFIDWLTEHPAEGHPGLSAGISLCGIS